MEGNNKLELLGNAPIPKALMSLGIPIMLILSARWGTAKWGLFQLFSP